jgi:hypothetical protein
VPAQDTLVAPAEETTEEELSRFIQLCEAGRFYDKMMEHFGIPSTERSRFKEKVFINVLFGDPKRSRHSREWKFFETAFPRMAQLICDIKREWGYRSLARLLQRVESCPIIDRVCGRLMREHGEVPVLTIHDSILTSKEHVSLLKSVIEEQFLRIGLRPTLHEQYRAEPSRSSTVAQSPECKRREPVLSNRRTAGYGLNQGSDN